MLYYRSGLIWELVEGTHQFHQRWETPSDKLVRSRKLYEEWAEFVHAVLSKADPTDVAEEACDVMVTLVGVLLTSSLRMSAIEDYFETRNDKIRPLMPVPEDSDRALDRMALDILDFMYAVYQNANVIHPFFWSIDTLLQITSLSGVSDDLLEESIRKVIAKNAAKTTETHYLDDKGMVARRPAHGANAAALSS